MKATDDTLLRRSSLFHFLSDEHFEKLRALLQEEHYDFIVPKISPRLIVNETPLTTVTPP